MPQKIFHHSEQELPTTADSSSNDSRLPETPAPPLTVERFNALALNNRLRRAKDNYLSQHATLSTEDRLSRAAREYDMEKNVAGLPKEQQTQAKACFYEAEVRAAAGVEFER